ncbi:MAG TPA: hypothetical protein VLF88_01795 [Candidatus Babeliales bacterium]|nr:hypothetical protein [Candidatus Babeliales bacterium]
MTSPPVMMNRRTFCRLEWLVVVLPIIVGVIILFAGGLFGLQVGIVIGLIAGLLLGATLWFRTPMPASETLLEAGSPE